MLACHAGGPGSIPGRCNNHFTRVGTYVQRGSKFCFVVVVVLFFVVANLLRILHFRPLSPCFQMLSILCHCMHVTLPGSLARQTCPADLPGRLARQTCPADLPGRLARQPCPEAKYQIQLKILHYCPISPCFQHITPLHAPLPCSPAALAGSLGRQPWPAALAGSLGRQPCPEALPGSLARQPCPAALPGSLARQPCPAALPKLIQAFPAI
jgi:hypothetical protein